MVAFAIKMRHAHRREHPAGVGRGREKTGMKSSKGSLGAGVLLAGAWAAGIQTPT